MSLRERIAAVVVGAVVATVLIVAVALRDAEPDIASAESTATSPLARTALTPAAHRFGETVTATIEALVPKNQLQLDTLAGTGSFDPYEVVDREREVLDAGDRWLVRYTISLQCVKVECVPEGQTGVVEFEGGALRWRVPPPPGRRFRDRRFDDRAAPAEWQPLTVVRTLSSDDVEEIGWRSTLGRLPEAGFRVSPGLLSTLLLGSALVLVLAAAALVAAWLRREHGAAVAAAAVDAQVETAPLERALALLGTNGDGDRRRVALETLARELRREGEHHLANEAETLAWSQDEPDDRRVDELAVAVRQTAVPA